MNTTELVPTVDFEGEPIWTEEPDDAEIAERREAWHRPYHEAIAAEIERVKARHGIAVLYDCHSIRGPLPFLFEGRLPDFHSGDNRSEESRVGKEGVSTWRSRGSPVHEKNK